MTYNGKNQSKLDPEMTELVAKELKIVIGYVFYIQKGKDWAC